MYFSKAKIILFAMACATLGMLLGFAIDDVALQIQRYRAQKFYMNCDAEMHCTFDAKRKTHV